jgi:hypothetical protein
MARKMSTSEEINEVFREDIDRMTRVVMSKSGAYPFLDNMNGMNVIDMRRELRGGDIQVNMEGKIATN